MNPWLAAAAGGMQAGSQIAQAQSMPETAESYTAIGSAPQVDLLNQMIAAAQRGQGEFGFAPAARSANSTLANSLAGRGISQNSGVGVSALANMLAGAASQDASSRRNFAAGLVNSSPWTYNFQHRDATWGQTQDGTARAGGFW